MMSCSRRTPVPSGTTPISRREEPLVRRFAVIRLAPGAFASTGAHLADPSGPPDGSGAHREMARDFGVVIPETK